MKRALIQATFVWIVVSCMGCGSEAKKDDKSGPRVTGGTPVDSSVGPVKPSVGGEIKPGK